MRRNASSSLNTPPAAWPRRRILDVRILCFFALLPIAIMGVQLPELQFTSLEEIPARISTAQKAFLEHKTRDVEFRLVQLRKLYWA